MKDHVTLDRPAAGVKLTDSIEREWAAWEAAEQASFDDEASALVRYGLIVLVTFLLMLALTMS